MSSFDKFINSFPVSKNMVAKGKFFEKFVKVYLQNENKWKLKVKHVWLWDDWPEKWSPDTGIDLIVKDYSNKIWAVQAKNYNSKYEITRNDMAKFISASDKKIIDKRLLIATTDFINKNAQNDLFGIKSNFNIRPDKEGIFYSRSDFIKSSYIYPSSYKYFNKPKKIKIPRPKPYQREAIRICVKKFERSNRGQLIMACGTGKTLTSLWIAEQMKANSIIVFAPSLNLINDLMNEWANCSKYKINIMCVCSDKSVGNKKENYDTILPERSFPVTTNISEISEFMTLKGKKVIFCTYHSSILISKAQQKNKKQHFDLMICDEAHHIAGSSHKADYYKAVIDNKSISSKKRLFATATPKMYQKGQSAQAKLRGYELIGMDDNKDSNFGSVFYNFSFSDAINYSYKGKPAPQLTPFEVIVFGVEKKSNQFLINNRFLVQTKKGEIVTDSESMAILISTLKAIKKNNLNKLLTFHNKIEHAETFANQLNEIKKYVKSREFPEKHIIADHVSGEMSAGNRNQKISRLKNIKKNEVGIISNARCLREGVDIPTLDGVAFIEAKKSKIDIIQAVGRAIRLGENKKKGFLLLPIFINHDKDINKAISKTDLDKTWNVINALKSHDVNLVTELEEIRIQLGKKRKNMGNSWGVFGN